VKAFAATSQHGQHDQQRPRGRALKSSDHARAVSGKLHC
jgi:hypothetical protein